MLRDIIHGTDVHWLRYVYRFVVGKSATPFYYIVVLLQLTIITPWLVKIVREQKKVSKLLWLVTPVYLVYVYLWNFVTGNVPRFYETFFPAWFIFYYLGIHVRCGMKLKSNGIMVIAALLLSVLEAFGLRMTGMSIGFYTSQITIGSFLYSFAVIGWIFGKAEQRWRKLRILSKVGDCSYGIFYIHMLVLMVAGRLANYQNWFAYWGFRFVLTALLSFGIVYASQQLLKNKKVWLKFIGFI